MTDTEKLGHCLRSIVAESEVCKDCRFKHVYDNKDEAFCAFVIECLESNTRKYKKGWDE